MSSTASSSQGPAETERRRITVMFADISGFTAMVERRDSEEAYEVVTGCLKLLDSIARKHGGSVDKYLGDCIMAVFGLPLAIEEAPRAAVNAAIEMLRSVDALNSESAPGPRLDIHIGVNTGLAISGDVSGPLVREFAVLGDPVNVASRLKDQAPLGQVYVGEETWRYTRELFEYEPLAPIRTKGKEREILAYRLLSRREQIRRRGQASASIFSELVGRDGLMTELRAGLRMLRDGLGGIHVLVGEAGLGKTRILDELSRTPEAEGFDWLRGSGVAIGHNVAYHVFSDLIRTRLEIEEGEAEQTARAKLRGVLESVLREGAAEAQPLVASIIGLPVSPEERERMSTLGWDATESLILRTMTQLLLALTQGAPPVVVLDDLHWADGSSLRLLEKLFRIAHEHPVLFLLGARGEGYRETAGRLLGVLERDHAGRFRRHELGALPHESSRQLLRNLVRHGTVSLEFLTRIETATRGNPFFMEEVVRSLIETGVFVEGAQGMDLVGPQHAVEIPSSVHDVIMARVDRLPRDVRAVLQMASVVGTSVHRAVLRAALADTEDLDAKLAHLVHAGMLLPRADGRRWKFNHPLFREVTYQSILASRREERHRGVADAVESQLSESVPGFHAMLAYHLTQGRDLERAESHLFRAGEDATKLAAADEALSLFYDAADSYLSRNPDGGDPAIRADIEQHIARAHANRGELGDAIEHTNLALVALGERVPRSNLARALHALPGVKAALEMVFLRGPRSRPAATTRERRVIELMFDRARAQVTTTPAPSFVFDCFDTFRKIAAVDPHSLDGVGGMLAGMVGPFTWGGLSHAASRRFLELAEPLVDPKDEAESFFFQAMRVLHHHQGGSWRDEHEIPPHVVDAALHRGLLWDVTNYLLFLGERRAGQGRFWEAGEVAQQLEKIADLYHYDLASSTEKYVRLQTELERGALEGALRTAEAYYTEHPETLISLLALGNRAKAELLWGDLEAARATLQESGRILAAERFAPPFHELAHWRSRLLLDVLELRRSTGRPPRALVRRARRDARRARIAASKVAMRAPEVLRLDAERLWSLGRRRRAARQAEASLAAARRNGSVPEQARTHAMLARWLRNEPATALAGHDAAGHRAKAGRLCDAQEPFGWGDAGPPDPD